LVLKASSSVPIRQIPQVIRFATVPSPQRAGLVKRASGKALAGKQGLMALSIASKVQMNAALETEFVSRTWRVAEPLKRTQALRVQTTHKARLL